ncbi:MAG TPA: START-like domain-containing protein [Bacteroidia bacterium]|nr:START-like domain-containing protein [Bacteroidia bacterium]
MAKKIATKKKIVKKIIATKKTAKAPQKNKKILKAKPVKKTSSKKISKPVIKSKPSKKAMKIVAKKTLPVKKNKIVSKTKPVKKIPVKKLKKIVKVKINLPEKTKILAPSKPEKQIQKVVAKSKKTLKQPKPKKIQSVYFIKNELLNLKLNVGKTQKKEPKGKYTLEYVVNCSPSILYEFLTTPSGLCEWFADDVNIRDNQYSFIWDGGEQIADILEATPNKVLKLKWNDRNDGSYFQFSIETDDLTNDVSLMITDFSENEAEKKSSQMLWDTQIQKLLHVLGSW